MDPQSIGMLAVFGGGFTIGLWYIVARNDAQLNMRHGMSPEGLRYNSGQPGFGNAKQQLNAKLAVVEERRRARELARGRLAQLEAEQNVKKQAAERAARQTAEQAREAERLRLAAIAEAQAEAEAAARQAEDEAERRRREREEARLAEARNAQLAELEAQRQSELEAAEAARLAEINAAREAEAVQSKQAAKAAMKELKERLEREGARSSDVQVSLMWNNFNDLDLHIVCPSGERIHGGNKISKCGGELDVDANVRPESKKPVENVYWPEGTAPAGQYQVYVHHYKKHKKRRSKDPTKFQVIANAYGDLLEYSGELTFGEEIQLVCSFNVPTMEEREEIKRQLEQQVRLAETGELPADKILEDEATPKQIEFGELVDEIESELVNEVEDDGSGVPPAPELD